LSVGETANKEEEEVNEEEVVEVWNNVITS